MSSLQFALLMLMMGAIVGVLVTLVVIVWGHLVEGKELLEMGKDYFAMGRERHEDAKAAHDDAKAVQESIIPVLMQKVDQAKDEVVDKVIEVIKQEPGNGSSSKKEDLRG